MFSEKDYYDVLNSFNLENIKGVVIDNRFDDLDEEKRETFMNNLKQCENLNYLKINSKEIEYIPDNLNNLEYLLIDEGLKIEDLLNNEKFKIKEIPKNLPKLRYLSIFFDVCKCKENYIEIPKSLTNLKVLDLYHTNNKIEIPETVENLKLVICPNINIDNLPNLKHLYICGSKLEKIPETFINLETLHLKNCNNIKEIPETLINLKEIDICNCDNLIIPDKIKNIPDIKIDQYNEICMF